MTAILIVLVASTSLAYLHQSSQGLGVVRDRSLKSWFEENQYVLLVAVILAGFVGLRTGYNDTWTYRQMFEQLPTGVEALSGVSTDLGSNPGHNVLSILIKTFVSDNPQVMLALYAALSIAPLAFFYKRWSLRFDFAIYLFVVSGFLLFSMAAMKQVLAMAIGVYGVSLLLHGHKWRFAFCVLLGSTFHPYLLMYLSALFLHDRVWSYKSCFIVVAAVLCGAYMGQFIELADAITQTIGKDYMKADELIGQGLNIYRFLVYCVTPALTFVYRDSINESGSRADVLFCNLVLVSWFFMFIALFANANMFGRMALYFEPFVHMALVAIVTRYAVGENQRTIAVSCCAGYFLFSISEILTRDFRYHWIFG